jgi:phenylacetate-CoA ligase
MLIIKTIYQFALKIYSCSPIILQNLAISAYGFILYTRRYGKRYRKYLNIYINRDYSSIVKEKARQNKLFLQLLHYTVEYSPFYKEFYKNIDISKIQSVEDIHLLPILTKETLRANLDRIYTISKKKALVSYTGGTTGTPMSVLKRKNDVQRRMAYLDAYKWKYGFINNKMKSARFFGKNIINGNPKNHIYWRQNYISKQRYYSTYYLQEDNLKYYVADLNSFKPDAIDGFVSAIYAIAKYIKEHQITLTFKPKAVFTTAETVLPIHRELIEKVFCCPLSDQYASGEGAPFIKQCILGSYHECLDTGVFEHIKTDSGIKLIVTSFDSFGTPLIRYDIGDDIIETEKINCPCGSVHPVIGRLNGRSTDYLITKSRGKISLVNLSVMISELPKVFKNIQFIQEQECSIKILLAVEKSLYQNEYNELLIKKLQSYLGSDMAFSIEIVDEIKRTNSGKYRMILNKLNQ